MIKILDNAFNRLAILKNVISPSIQKEINGEYTLKFECVLDAKTSNYVNENNYFEIDNDYFQLIYYQKKQNDDGTLTMQVDCEHVGYKLNNAAYDLDIFAHTGTPTQVLTQILLGTGFTVGTVEPSDSVTYAVSEKKSRRQLLMGFVSYLGAEIDFAKMQVNLLNHVGASSLKILAKGKNIKVVGKTYDAKDGAAKISYTVTPIQLDTLQLSIGDEILLVHKDLDIQEQMRIVRITYNPYDSIEASIELANFVPGIEDQFYRIETQQVTKEKVYNGCKIGPDEGFVAERTDRKAKTVVNATDGISIYGDTGDGLERNFYVGTDGRIKAKDIDIDGSGTFGGSVTAATILGGTIAIGLNNNIFKADGVSGIWLGHANYASAPFKVSLGGVVSATGVSISGALTITSGSGIANLSDAGNLATVDDLDGVGNGASYGKTTHNQVTGAGKAYSALGSSNELVTKVLPGSNVGTPAGAGLYMGADYMGYYSGAEWKSFINNSGQFTFKGDTSNYVSWNGSALTVRGTLNASDITAGTLSASRINTSGLAAEKIYQAGSPNNYGVMGGTYGDLALYYAGSEYFRIYNDGANVQLKYNSSPKLTITSDSVESGEEFRVGTGGTGTFRHILRPSDGLIATEKYSSGSWVGDGLYAIPTYPLLGTRKNGNWDWYVWNNGSVKAFYNGANYYMETNTTLTTAKNTWNFDGTLQYGGTDINDKYCKNMSSQKLKLQYYGGYLEIWDGASYIGKCTII